MTAHVVSSLIEKRRELAGIIDELQRQLDQHRADLTHIYRAFWQGAERLIDMMPEKSARPAAQEQAAEAI